MKIFHIFSAFSFEMVMHSIIRKLFGPSGFSKMLIRCYNSKAHGIYCKRVYGKNLCQCNMVDMDQLNKLVDLLKFEKDRIVLDLGCGIGTITEFIADLNQAKVTGVDFAQGAIRSAQERTKNKTDFLSYQIGNLNNLDLPARSFDLIICIDSLSFVKDLDQFIRDIKDLLKPRGTIGLFYNTSIKENESKALLLPENTKLAKSLRKHDLTYETYDFTKNDYEIWTKGLQTVEDLKSEFEREDNIDIYRARLEESKKHLDRHKSNRVSRFLYLANER